jgi:hypothetical protein
MITLKKGTRGRGRDGDCSPPPAQIPACAANATGSCLRSDVIGLRGIGYPCSSDPWARCFGGMLVPAQCPGHASQLTLPSTGRRPSTVSAALEHLPASNSGLPHKKYAPNPAFIQLRGHGAFQTAHPVRPIPHGVRGTVGCKVSRGFVLWRVADAGWRRLWLRLSWPASATLHICYDRRRWIRRQPCPLTGVSRSLSKIDLLGDLGGRLPPLCRSNLLISRQVAVFTRPRPTANLRRPT